MFLENIFEKRSEYWLCNENYAKYNGWVYHSSYFGIFYYNFFSYFSREEEVLEQIEKCNALKSSKSEVVAETEDTLECATEEETASYVF